MKSLHRYLIAAILAAVTAAGLLSLWMMGCSGFRLLTVAPALPILILVGSLLQKTDRDLNVLLSIAGTGAASIAINMCVLNEQQFHLFNDGPVSFAVFAAAAFYVILTVLVATIGIVIGLLLRRDGWSSRLS